MKDELHSHRTKRKKYNSLNDIKGFDWKERLECWLLDDHYFMTPYLGYPVWCGFCGKIIKPD